ncbi:MAG: nucleotidyltransferase family protein [Oscillospiraceae bacterium]|nr:nucleotidyltransferase family protein [Oscillospiraceae bacterium]
MKALILAAGYATRLYPLTENFPKPLLDVGGKAILDWLIEDLQTSGMVDEYVVISNHKFAQHFRDWAAGHSAPVTVVDDGTSTNETRLGAVKDIQFALEARQIDGDVVVLAGDNVLDFSLVPFLRYGQAHNCSCVMCYEEPELARQQRTAIITIDAARTITDYEEKPKAPKSCLAVPPFYYYRAQDVRRIPEGLADGCGYDAPGSFAAWLSRRTTLKAYPMPGNRYDVGNLASYESIKASYRGITVKER